ncbi:MAG: tetratricopeptide repeat protein [Hyphomonadaceae bacterium]
MAIDPVQEPVCRGFSEDLITLLSRMRQFVVLDRSSTLALRSGHPDAHVAGRRLGARYLLEGSLSPVAAGQAIAVRLTDLETGRTIWSDIFEPGEGDFLGSLQDVSRRVAGALGGRIEHAEGAHFRGRRESRVGVRGLLWRSRWHLDQLTRQDAEEALRLLQEAQQSDPDNPEVLIQLAHWRWVDAWTMRRSEAAMRELRDLAVAARDADPLDGRGHLLIGVSEILLGRHRDALAHLQKAVDVNPSLAMGYAQMGSCHNLMGAYTVAIPDLELALRLSPRDYYAFYVFGELAISHVLMEDWPRAIAHARKALALRPSYWNARMSEIAALVHSGDLEAAALSYQTLMFRTPKFTLRYIEWLPYDAPSVRAFFSEAIEQARRVGSTLN